MRLAAALLTALAGTGTGFWMGAREQARARLLMQLGDALERICTGAVRFKTPLGDLMAQAGAPILQVWRKEPAAGLAQEDVTLLEQLFASLGRMDGQNCAQVCRGVTESWQAHALKVGQQAEKTAKLWRVLCACAALTLAIWML